MKNTFIKISLSFCFVLLATAVFANDTMTTQGGAGSLFDWTYEHIVFVLGGLIIFGAVLGIVRLNSQLLELQKIKLLEEHGIEAMEKLNLTQGESALSAWIKKVTQAVPVEKEEDVMLDHDYDGIRELDNILPPWWVSLFNISIVISVIYFGYYEMTDYGQTQTEEWETEMAEAKIAIRGYLLTQEEQVDESTVVALTSAGDIAAGKSIFEDNFRCTACHGPLGEGISAPNFTDKYWKHGGGIKNVFKTIKYGVPEKGMIAWKTQLSANEMQKVASYILTLEGTDPPNGKAPEGELWEGMDEETTDEEATEE